MGAHDAREYWEGPGLVWLVGSFLAAPLAWLLDLQTSYTLVRWACAHDARTVLLLPPLGSLTLIGLGTAAAWSCWTALRSEGRMEGGRTIDRSGFLALAALAMHAVFALLILTSLVPRLVLSPCE